MSQYGSPPPSDPSDPSGPTPAPTTAAPGSPASAHPDPSPTQQWEIAPSSPGAREPFRGRSGTPDRPGATPAPGGWDEAPGSWQQPA